MLHNNNEAHGHVIAKAAKCGYNPARDQVISRTKDDTLVAGVIYQDYTRACITCHIAGFGSHWLNKELLWAMFNYPFVKLECTKILGFLPSYNLKSLEFNKKLGFIEETKIADVFPDGDLIVLSMTPAQCRFLEHPTKFKIRNNSNGR